MLKWTAACRPYGRGMAGMGGEVASFPTDAGALVPKVGITGVLKLR
jgi:hypothetical protein